MENSSLKFIILGFHINKHDERPTLNIHYQSHIMGAYTDRSCCMQHKYLRLPATTPMAIEITLDYAKHETLQKHNHTRPPAYDRWLSKLHCRESSYFEYVLFDWPSCEQPSGANRMDCTITKVDHHMCAVVEYRLSGNALSASSSKVKIQMQKQRTHTPTRCSLVIVLSLSVLASELQ